MASVPLRVCLVAPAPPPYGGIANWTRMILGCAARRTDARLLLVNTAVRWREVDDLTTWKRVLGGGGQLFLDLSRLAGALCRRPHVIHLVTSGQFGLVRDIAVMGMARLLHVPTVYHLRFGRVPDLASDGTSWEWRYLARALRLATKVIALDAATADAVRRHLPEVAVTQLPNCIDFSALPPAGTAVAMVVYLGWVIPTKGMEELVSAWAGLAPDAWRLVLVGPGNRKYQEELLSRHRPKNIEFLGEVPHDEAMRLLARAAVFVLPSHTEGFPNVVMEAMALGKPVVATRVGAIPEMLGERCSLLVDKGDAQGLKTALQKAMSDAELRTAVGRQNVDRAQEYSLEKVFSRYMRLWRQVAGHEEAGESVCK